MDSGDVWGLGSALPGAWSWGGQLSSVQGWWEAGAGISVMRKCGVPLAGAARVGAELDLDLD